MDTKLIKAVTDQLGENAIDTLKDVAKYGAASGFHGFIYTKDTCEFYLKNRDLINKEAEEAALDAGVGVLELIQDFLCLKDANYPLNTIAHALYTDKESIEISDIQNAMAWFALESASYFVEIQPKQLKINVK